MSDYIVVYNQIRGTPAEQQDALLVATEVQQEDSVSGRIACAEPILVGVADGVASTPEAATMSRRLLQCSSRVYWRDRWAFNAKLIRRAQVALSLAAARRPLRSSSASTIVLAEIKDGVVTVLNTGDSRAYLIDKSTGRPRRLSKDHTSLQLLKDDGELPADAQDCDYGSVATGLLEAVTAAQYSDDEFAVNMAYAHLKKNEIVLLCSDGVTTYLSDTGIGDAVARAYASAQDPAQSVIDLVERAGAQDNTTVVIVDADGAP